MCRRITPRQSDFRSVRAVFEKVDSEWKPFPNNCRDPDCLTTVTARCPKQVTWTIAFDGRNLGRVEARTPKNFQFYSPIGFEDIVSRDPVPTVGKRLMEYSDFLGAPFIARLSRCRNQTFKTRSGGNGLLCQPMWTLSCAESSERSSRRYQIVGIPTRTGCNRGPTPMQISSSGKRTARTTTRSCRQFNSTRGDAMGRTTMETLSICSGILSIEMDESVSSELI